MQRATRTGATTGDGVDGTTTRTWPAPAGQVRTSFWLLAGAAMLCGAAAQEGWWPALASPVVTGAVAVMLIGGLPHGACDLSLAAGALRLGSRDLALVLVLYLAVAAAMALLWVVAPVAALVLFLGLAGVHFGEDWTMLPPGLLRAMAGMAVIATAALGQPTQVAALFTAMTGSGLGVPIARWAAAAAPVTGLVTLVGLMLAWRDGHCRWVVAQVVSYAGLLVLPPLLGFCVFFAGLHAPLHWHTVMHRLQHRNPALVRAEGGALTTLTLAVWLVALMTGGRWMHLASGGLPLGAEAFRLLSIVAAPHLALSLAIDRRLARDSAQAAPGFAPIAKPGAP
ncbi:beta-carotene 15,15'-dioxygenase, Brp/Blh family [Novosphingobium sp.]|uniref:beta-carotene 15,15'-dioxygenase, Brp/Blh family n=1 Tax=Novosphingobium sp. TaxID=1874826 RepID=UPI00334273F0